MLKLILIIYQPLPHKLHILNCPKAMILLNFFMNIANTHF